MQIEQATSLFITGYFTLFFALCVTSKDLKDLQRDKSKEHTEGLGPVQTGRIFVTYLFFSFFRKSDF